MSWLRFLNPTCREVSRWTSQSLDAPLPWHVRARVRMHLLICVLCRRYRAQLTALHTLLSRNADRLVDTPEQLPPEAKERIKREMKERG